ncbi:peptidase T4 [Actinomyces timonensis]|uniref:Peptidase T4 n=1 Tax=Actinomyces timonensis TaxID=1288391 RepID=A0AAU8N3T6_9ACTO
MSRLARARWLMAPGWGAESERGSATVEFIGWSAAIVLPILYLIVALAQAQAASLAVASAADSAARAMESSAGGADGLGPARARAAVGLALADQGLDDDPATALALDCEDSACSRPRAVRVEVGVDLPLVSMTGIGDDLVMISAVRPVSTIENGVPDPGGDR